MPDSKFSIASPTHTSASDADMHSVKYVHTISEAGRFLPSASQWNSTEIDFNLAPQSSNSYGSLPSRYSKSFDYDLVITDKAYFKRFLYISALAALLIPALVLLIHFLPHKHHPHSPTKNLTLAVNQALTFFDAQKSGNYPNYSPVKFRGNSGMQDGKVSNLNADLVGGFYDSGNNIKFSFPTAYAVTILSWSDIIKWGSDYLLKVFVPTNSTPDSTILYSQVGSTGNDTKVSNDINCWQRPEDMSYVRPVSVCDSTASDLAGEIIAALSAASIVFKDEIMYSGELIKAAGKLYEVTSREDPGRKQGTYTKVDACGGEARDYYNSTSFIDELVWGGTWLFFATGNNSYLAYATERFKAAEDEETESEKGIFYWNNKLTATAVLLTRLRFFRDLGYPYEGALRSSSSRTEILMCSYLSDHIFNKTQGGLILLRPGSGGALEFAATASFLSKLYSDYLDLLRRSGGSCGNDGFSLQMLRRFSISQVHYILGDNPMKMSYMVGFGDKYPYQVHHRSASIPWDDGQHYTCAEGDRWLYSKEPNPNLLVGAMVAGPDIFDNFSDERDKLWFTEPSIASNAGLVAALIALHDPPRKSSNSASLNLGIDQTGIFDKIHSTPSNP
ncbi:Endoglucanase 10 [Citrus sinensis]|uniref:Endoglucanase 10 n=1 Tax=Citrus sinensis TaxID=2711 RepID=A0ACB8KSQ2_CITSI|nr:Endoglucanase 10 [Citrus sinensis]